MHNRLTNRTEEEHRTDNTGLAKVAVQCSADKFVVNQSLVLRINICGDNRHLRQARNRGMNSIFLAEFRIILDYRTSDCSGILFWWLRKLPKPPKKIQRKARFREMVVASGPAFPEWPIKNPAIFNLQTEINYFP